MAGKMRFIHDVADTPNRGVRRRTVVGRFNKENNTVSYAQAICAPGDVFSRKEGRRVAIEKLESGNCVTVPASMAEAGSLEVFLGNSLDYGFKNGVLYHDFHSYGTEFEHLNRIILRDGQDNSFSAPDA